MLQQLVAASVSNAIGESGLDQIGGYFTEASAVVGLRTPANLLAAFGVDADPNFADVVRFEQPPLTTFSLADVQGVENQCVPNAG